MQKANTFIVQTEMLLHVKIQTKYLYHLRNLVKHFY